MSENDILELQRLFQELFYHRYGPRLDVHKPINDMHYRQPERGQWLLMCKDCASSLSRRREVLFHIWEDTREPVDDEEDCEVGSVVDKDSIVHGLTVFLPFRVSEEISSCGIKDTRNQTK